MRILAPQESLDVRPVVTIGTFDGIHPGHQALFAKAQSVSQARHTSWMVVTFDPPPAVLLRHLTGPTQLTPLPEKLYWLEQWGVPAVMVMPFTPQLAATPAQVFLDQVVGAQLNAQAVVEGADFTFGQGGRGNQEVLRAWARPRGVDVFVLPKVQGPHGPFSSSRIRQAIQAGQLAIATEGLARPYHARGHVVPGDGRGRSLGVPTANIALPPGKLMPPPGIYAGHVHLAQDRRPAVASWGFRPTFEGQDARLEVHVLDVDRNFRGQVIGFDFEYFLRPEQRFAAVLDLVHQMRRDMDQARRLLS